MTVNGAYTFTAFPSLARTATPTAFVANDGNNGRTGGHFVVNVTAIGAAPSVVFNIEGFDLTSNTWYTIITSAAVVATTPTVPIVLRVYPGSSPVANLTVSDFLPQQWRIRPVHANGDSITYSVGVTLRE